MHSATAQMQQICLNHRHHHLRNRVLNLKSSHNVLSYTFPSNRLNYKSSFHVVKSSLYSKRRFLSTASSSRILATTTNSSGNALEGFLGWALANGIEGLDGDKSKIGLFIGKDGERGITATASLRRNETFAKIPLRLAITDDPSDEESNTLVGKDAPWSVRLACKLLRLKSQGAASPWFPYLNSLPPVVPSPLINFSWEDIQSIAYEPARRHFDRSAWMVSSAWTSLPPTATTTTTTVPPPSREEFDWAISIVHSRTFGTAGKSGGVGVRMLVPLVDMLNHSGDQDFSMTNNTRKGGPTIMPPPPPPVATATDNVRWDLVSKIGGEFFMVLTATRDIQKGEELLLSYGERNNDDFFLHYGFIPPLNIHDDVILFSSIEEAIDWHLEKYIPLGVLPPTQLQEAITAAYAAALREEDWGGGRSNGGAGASSMEAALEAMPEAEAEHIRRERSAIKLLSKGRTDGRLVAAIESLHSTARIAGSADVARNCQDHVREAVAARAVEVLRNMYITAGVKLEEDLKILATCGSDGGGGNGEDEHGFKIFAEYYTAAISSSPWKDKIYTQNGENTAPSSSLSSTENNSTLAMTDAGLGGDFFSGNDEERASLLAALQAANPLNTATVSSTSPPSGSFSKSPFIDIDEPIDSTESTSAAVPLLVRQYRAYKAMILWDALLC